MTNSQLPARIRDDDDYKRARTFKDNVKAKDGVDYEWVIEYAKDHWEHRQKILGLVDEKADSLIKYLGGGIALIILGVLAKINEENAYLAVWFVPSIVAAMLSIRYCVKARKPEFKPSPPSIELATEYAETEENQRKAMVAFLGQWHLVCEGTMVATFMNSDRVSKATTWYFWSIALLLLPLFSAIYNNIDAISIWYFRP